MSNFNIAEKRKQLQKSVETNIQGHLLDIPVLKTLEKSRPLNPNLVLTHIIDKNGHHRIVWKSREDIEASAKTHQEVQPGNKVTFDGEEQEVHNVKRDGYVTLKRADGTKHDKSLKKVKFHHPTTGEADTGEFFHDEATTAGRAPVEAASSSSPNSKAEPEKEEGLDYELYGSPEERMSDWVDMIGDFADGNSKNLVIAYGTGGVGKTFNVLQNQKITDGLASGEYVKVTGGTTPAGFFEMLYENRDKKIILDDFDMVYNDPQMLGLLATISRSSDERVLTYPGSMAGGSDIPERFEFTGKIMSISNINLEDAAKGNNASKFEELLTNSNKVNLYMTKKETWDLINQYILHRNGAVNMGLKFRNAYGDEIQSTVKDREELSEYFKKNWQDMRELSGRTLTKANAIQQYYKSNGDDWTKKADQMLLEGGGTDLSVQERFKDFNDSVSMIANGDIKSAVIVDVNSDRVVESLKSKGFKNTPTLSKGFDLQNQMNPEYIPRNDENFATEMYIKVQGSNISDKALYETLWKHNGKVIVFDNTADKFLKSDIGQGLLKGALDTSGDGQLTWLSKSNMGKFPAPAKQPDQDELDYQNDLINEGFSFETLDNGRVDPKTLKHPNDLPDRFEFKGRCIFITSSSENAPQPIQSRSVLADINVSPKDFLVMAEEVASKREKLGNTFSNIHADVSPSEYRHAVEFLRNHEGKIHDRHFSEEGVQAVVGKLRTYKDLPEEERNKTIKRQLMKGIDTDLGEEIDIFKAFEDLLS